MSRPATTAYAAAAPPTGPRPHDITVFGCTGNAGRAVAYQAVKSAVTERRHLRVALAGRNRAKVETTLRGIRDELRSEGISKADDATIDVVIADVSDDASMAALAQSTNVLVSCAGPYWRYGEPVVRACVEGGAHYVDITGEWQWVERMIAEYGQKAEEAGVVLCPFSGYDCLPAELGMELVGSALAMEGIDAKLGDLAMNFGSKGGGFPRGTLYTMLDAFERKDPPRREGTPRFYPKEYRGTFKSALSLSNWVLPKYQLGQFTAPNMMKVCNTPVLCRAAPILGFSSDLTISDRSAVTGRPSLLNGYGLVQAQVLIATLIVGGLAFALPPFRSFLRGKLDTYSYNGDPAGKTFANARGLSTDKKVSASAKCMFPGDPGIYATGLFAAGVATALHEATTAGSKFAMPIAGFHSPVAALHRCRPGLLAEHLRDLGAEIKVEVVPEGGAAREVDTAKLRSKL